MIIPDDKKTASVIVGRLKDGASYSSKPEYEINENDRISSDLAGDVLAAFEKKSASDLMRALKAFISHCLEYDK